MASVPKSGEHDVQIAPSELVAIMAIIASGELVIIPATTSPLPTP